MIVVVDQLAPLVARNPNGKIVGIESRPAHHSQDLSVAWIHSHDGSVFISQGLLCGDLQIKIDGQPELSAGLGWSLIQALNFSSPAVHHRTSRAVLAH